MLPITIHLTQERKNLNKSFGFRYGRGGGGLKSSNWARTQATVRRLLRKFSEKQQQQQALQGLFVSHFSFVVNFFTASLFFFFLSAFASLIFFLYFCFGSRLRKICNGKLRWNTSLCRSLSGQLRDELINKSKGENSFSLLRRVFFAKRRAGAGESFALIASETSRQTRVLGSLPETSRWSETFLWDSFLPFIVYNLLELHRRANRPSAVFAEKRPFGDVKTFLLASFRPLPSSWTAPPVREDTKI